MEKDYMFINVSNVLKKVVFKDILYIQALGDYCNIFTSTNRYTTHSTLKKIEEFLSSTSFYRCHRSYLVNIDRINSIEQGTLYIDKHPLPIGEQYKKDLLKMINYF